MNKNIKTPTEPVEKCKECQFEKGHSQGCSEYIAGKPFESTEPVTEDWEIQFEETFYTKLGDEYWLDNGYYSSPDRELGDKIKAFIRQTRLDLLNEIEKELEKKKKSEDKYNKRNNSQILWTDIGFNQALQVGVDIINKHKK